MTDQFKLPPPRRIVFFADRQESHRVLLDVARRRGLREVYGQTEVHEGLCAFDAHGMDVMEGRG